jgi:protein-L-isoaspartate O-methyltransferase
MASTALSNTWQEDDVATTKQRTVSQDARNVLWRSTVQEDAISLPPGQLDRALYEEVNSVLEALGGKWNRSKKAHIFVDLTGSRLSERFYEILESGTWDRPQDHGYYPTPDDLAMHMVTLADIQPHHRVLEPSAGRGAIATKIAPLLSSANQMSTFEYLPDNMRALYDLGFIVDGQDFLEFEGRHLFDRVVMNPPFAGGAAPRHVLHAMQLLKTGGKLVAIMPSSIMQRQDGMHRACRQQIIVNGKITPLPDATFASVGTMVRTVLVEWTKPADWPIVLPGMAPVGAQRVVTAPEPTEVATESRKPFKRLSRRFRRLGKRRTEA